MKQLHHSLFTFLVLSFSTFAHAQWTIINQTLTTDMAFESVAQPRKDTILFSGNFTNTVYNLNGGESGWGLVSSASPGLADMSFGSKKVGYGAASTPVNLRKTINSGASWTTITPISSNSMWCAFAVDENTGDIKGITSLKKIFMIEPLISESAVVANNLFRMIDGFVKGIGIKKIRATVDNDDEKFMKVLDKENFKLINLSKSTVER